MVKQRLVMYNAEANISDVGFLSIMSLLIVSIKNKHFLYIYKYTFIYINKNSGPLYAREVLYPLL